MKDESDLSGNQVIILAGECAGVEGVSLGRTADADRFAVSPDGSNIVLELTFGHDFGLLLRPPVGTRKN